MEPRRPAPALEGTNWDGSPFRLADRTNRVGVVFFGYTFCPDVCPFTLAKLQQIMRNLGPSAAELDVIFVSVDPHRDSVQKLAGYVPNFDERFLGLHLDDSQLSDATDDWDLTVQYGQPRDGPGTDSFYYVDHTGTYFLIDRHGDLAVEHPPNTPADDLQADLERLLEEDA